MLNQDALAQLRQLKQQIQDHKVHASGVVRGTQGRYGFVVLDDGSEIYLSAEQMHRVFPDDRIDIEVITGADGKSSAQLEKLVSSELRQFTGQYVVRDNAHFVEPDLPRLSRWIFVPPKMRMNAQHGDYVCARITRHPFADGKPQARIEKIIGTAQQPGIHALYALARFQLPSEAPTLAEADLQTPDSAARRDLTALPLVTIDGAETRDMDDALHAEALPAATGWRLTVAIADPSAWIKPGSALDTALAARASSVYLPGMTVAMLPEALANDRCSLLPEAERLALVCELTVDSSGGVTDYSFSEARVRSSAKLSYDQVNRLFAAPDQDAPWATSLGALRTLSECLQQRRQRENIVLPERGEYRALLDANRVVERYLRQEKTAAHQLVEECMIATNRCAADFLRNDSAIFVSHRGFRAERREAVAKLLAEHLSEATNIDIAALPGYVELIHRVAAQPHELPLREILFRSLERAQFALTAAPHFGMGLPAYTTITSPIRKYNDFLLHRLIKAKLHGTAAPALDANALQLLQEGSDRARQASNLAQQWLDCEYLQRQPAQQWQAEIVQVNSSGIVVRLLDNGIQGFVDLRQTGEKFSFDTVCMQLSSPTRVFQLEQRLAVTVANVDMKKRAIGFALAETSA